MFMSYTAMCVQKILCLSTPPSDWMLHSFLFSDIPCDVGMGDIVDVSLGVITPQLCASSLISWESPY